MRRAVRFSLLVVMAVAAAACDEGTTGPTVTLNQQFVLAPDEVAMVQGEDAAFHFTGVTGDSRCPADAVCVLGGDAVVRLEAGGSAGQQVLELHTGNLQPVKYGGLTVTLVDLQPYPFTSRPVEPDDYRATLRVTK